jgi:HlyD family secretion protein
MPRILRPLFASIPWLLVACDPGGAGGAAAPQAARPAEPPMRVAVARAAVESWPAIAEETNGSLEAWDRSTLGAEIAGRVVALEVDVGSVVAAGDVVARIDPDDYEIEVTRAEAMLHQARALLGLPLEGDDDAVDPENTAQVRLARAVFDEAEAKRQRAATLLEKDVIGDAEFDEAEAAARVAAAEVQGALQEIASLEAQLEERRSEFALARSTIAKATIHAPYDGVVLRRRVGLGDFATSGTPIVDLLRTDPLRLRADVPERFVPRLAIGQVMRFRLEGSDEEHESRVARIPPELERASRSLRVEGDVQNRRDDGTPLLRAGSFARIEIVLDESTTALAVPARSIKTFAGVDRVVTIEDGKAKEVLVKIGRRGAERVEILEGIAAGTIVVLDPGGITTGRAVEIAAGS